MLMRRFRRLSIRDKLLALVLLPLVVVLPLLGVILFAWAGSAFDRLLITKVRADLAVAHGYFERVVGDLGANVGSAADSHALNLALARGDASELATLLRTLKLRYGFDFINLRASDGTLRLTPFGTPAQVAEESSADAAAPRAAAGAQTPVATLERLPLATLALLAPDLAARVAVPLLPTRNAAPTARTIEERAMVALAAAPVRADGGTLLGYVQAGVLLNRNLPFIDHINDIVYPPGSLPFGSQGTATLFLDDVRIATNVHLFGGDRAIGTRVSQAVRDAVLGRGETWLDRAFVVDDWYVSAYRPLEDGTGHPIGMLYVGVLERPFAWVKWGMLASVGAMFVAVMAGAALVSLRWAREVFCPLEQMTRTIERIEAGERGARVGEVSSGDEIGRLAGHFDHLLDAVARQTGALERWNAELDAKVVERTRALEETQQQLLRAERLAAMGQLTAGIAHEVNNPIAVIQGNLDLVRELLGVDTYKVRDELRLVDAQIDRIRRIVAQMLQFARPGEFPGEAQQVDCGAALDDALLLAGTGFAMSGVIVERRYGALRRAAVNWHELQQVLVNLLANALWAMPDGGVLDLTTRDEGEGQVTIEVADTGPGLRPELLGELFKPFVTGRKEGTGLGLWISRSIVERYGGDIVARNRAERGAGACFTIRLNADVTGTSTIPFRVEPGPGTGAHQPPSQALPPQASDGSADG